MPRKSRFGDVEFEQPDPPNALDRLESKISRNRTGERLEDFTIEELVILNNSNRLSDFDATNLLNRNIVGSTVFTDDEVEKFKLLTGHPTRQPIIPRN